MKHVKLFEDFGSSNYGGNKNSSNLVLTGNEGDGYFALSHIENEKDVNLLKMRFSGNDDVFDVIPYTGKNYVGSDYDDSGNITLREYRTAKEGLEYGYYGFITADNIELGEGEGEGNLWSVPPVGFTIYADKGYATTITNDRYLTKNF
jgi:hypothetical protein